MFITIFESTSLLVSLNKIKEEHFVYKKTRKFLNLYLNSSLQKTTNKITVFLTNEI